MRQLIKLCFILLFLFNVQAYADEALLKRKEVQQFISTMVQKHDFKRQQLTEVFKEARFQPQIIESMNKPFEKKTWDIYKKLFLTPERVQKGIQFWQANQATLEKAQKQYGVPAPIIVAIIGVETFYGERQGNYRVLDALTTLAFNYPKRAEFFTKELKEYLLLCREHGVSPTKYLGSYAGAIGKPQFMPSSYRFYAVDFAGNGKKDLINEDKDVIGSVANYFHKHGWKMDELVVLPATVHGSAYKKIKTTNKKAAYDVKHLLASGVEPLMKFPKQPEKAGLIELMTDKGQEYWLAYPNFYVITRYNSSPQYALAVYLLSQQLRQQWSMAQRGQSAYA